MKNFVYLNVPLALTRKFEVMDATSGRVTADVESMNRHMRVLHTQVKFFVENGLLRSSNLRSADWRSVCLEFEDFTDLGQRFVKSGAIEKWLRALDRSRTTSPDDTSTLDRELAKLARAGI